MYADSEITMIAGTDAIAAGLSYSFCYLARDQAPGTSSSLTSSSPGDGPPGRTSS